VPEGIRLGLYAMKHVIMAICAVDSVECKKRNTKVEIKELAKTNHSLRWDTLELLVDMTIAKYGDDPQFASTLRHFVEESCGEPEGTPISKAVHDIWYEIQHHKTAKM
jgi:hypothetical protein